jgi:hypothetical protein
VLAVVAAFYAVFVPLRIHQYSVAWFAHVGATWLRSAHTSTPIDRLHAPRGEGYDGQFYLFIALDPSHAADYMRHGPGGDQSGKRFARIGYPLLTRAASAGQPGAVPYAMLVLNLLAIGAGTFLLAAWLVRNGASPWLAALYGLWPGMSFAVFRDLSEPTAYALAIAAVVVFPRRVWLACGLLAASLLCRETVIAFPFALAVGLWLRERRPARPLAFLAAALAPVVAWRVFVTHWLHATTFDHTGGLKVLLPFYGIHSYQPWDGQHWLIVLTVYLPLLLASLGGLLLLWRREHVTFALLLLLDVALFVVFVPHIAVIDYGAAGRVAAPALIGAIFCAPFIDRRAVAAVAALASPVWFVVVAALYGLPSLALVTT